MKMEESITVFRAEDHSNVNELCITKLFQIVQFLGRNNLQVKFMFPKFINFLAYEMQEPILSNTLTHVIKMLLTLQVIHMTLFASN